MSSAVVIELANSAATRVFDNGDYECAITPPKIINAGDQMYVRLAAVDGATPVGQILISEDLVLTFRFYLYEMDTPFVGQEYKHYIILPQNLERPDDPTFFMYLGMTGEATATPIERTATITVPAGGYSPAALAEIITKLCVAPLYELAPSYFNKRSDPVAAGLAQFSPMLYQLPRVWDDDGNAWSQVFWTRINSPLGIVTGSIQPKDRYVYQLADVSQATVLPSMYLMCGAVEFSLTYDEGGCSAFRFSYAHTPVMNPNDATGAPVVAEAYRPPLQMGVKLPEGCEGVHLVARSSGIMFSGLEPASFWQDTLGFDLGLGDDGLPTGLGILVKFVPGQGLVNFNERRHLTSNIYGSADRITNGSRIYSPTSEDSVGPVYHASDATWPIIAAKWFSASSTSLYLVELIGGAPSEYQAAGVTFRAIAAITAKTWSASSFVVSYADGALPYIHTSEIPLIISSIRVRILDASTKALSSSLGPNSIVLLNIVSGSQPVDEIRTPPRAAEISHDPPAIERT